MLKQSGLFTYLFGFRNDVFKLLPMKESADIGDDNHLLEYLDTLISNARGALLTFPELNTEKKYINVTNNLCYLLDAQAPFSKWRKIVLNSTRNIEDLRDRYSGETKNERSS